MPLIPPEPDAEQKLLLRATPPPRSNESGDATPRARSQREAQGLPSDIRMDSVPIGRARCETRYRPTENIERANPAKTKSGVNHRVRSADRCLLHNRRRPITTRRSMQVDMRQSSRPPAVR